MNILIYTQWSSYLGYSIGGAETSLRVLAEKLAQEGHSVTYLTEKKGGRLPRHESKTVKGVDVHFVTMPDLPSLGIGFLLNIRQKWINRYFDKICDQIIKEKKIDVVHTYHEIPGMLRFLKLKNRKGYSYKTVLRNGGKFWVKKLRENPELSETYRYVFNSVDSVNFNTRGMEELFDEACKKFRVDVKLKDRFVHDIGLERKTIDQQWTLPKENQPFKMVMASRFSAHQKRQRLLVEAVAKLPKEMEWELHLIGEGSKKEEIELFVKDEGMGEKVIFHPYLDQQKLWDLMCSSHLYVHACDFEGLSKIIIEAMGMGVPVLASDVVPLRDYIKDGETGFLVENRVELWADKIKEVAQKQDMLTTVSLPAKQFVEDHFSADKNVKIYSQYFERIAAT
ncbi:MAG: glycosyltransferase [Balneolaceae bacterium]